MLPGLAELPPCLPGSEAQGSFVLSDARPHSVVYLFPTISQEMWRGEVRMLSQAPGTRTFKTFALPLSGMDRSTKLKHTVPSKRTKASPGTV